MNQSVLKKEDPDDSLRGGGRRGWQPYKSLGHPPPCIHTQKHLRRMLIIRLRTTLVPESYDWAVSTAGNGAE